MDLVETVEEGVVEGPMRPKEVEIFEDCHYDQMRQHFKERWGVLHVHYHLEVWKSERDYDEDRRHY
jgi:hypothetical protein